MDRLATMTYAVTGRVARITLDRPHRGNAITFDMMISRNLRGFMSLFHGEKPVVCKVHGYCVAGGTDMALCSDLLVIEDKAKIGYPPARVWGSPTTAIWAYRIGLEKAKRLLFTGDSLSGEEAVAWGLATEAASRADLDARAEALVERIARHTREG